MKNNTIYVGLDVHKNSIDVALAEEGRTGEVRHYGSIGGDLDSLENFLKKISKPGRELDFVYEAGPCGYEIWRYLRKKGHKCAVISPAHIPKASAERIKTDSRVGWVEARNPTS